MNTSVSLIKRASSLLALMSASLVVVIAFMLSGGLSASAQTTDSTAPANGATATTSATPDSSVSADTSPVATSTAPADTASVTSDTAALPAGGVNAGFGGTASSGSDTARNLTILATVGVLAAGAVALRRKGSRVTS